MVGYNMKNIFKIQIHCNFGGQDTYFQTSRFYASEIELFDKWKIAPSIDRKGSLITH